MLSVPVEYVLKIFEIASGQSTMLRLDEASLGCGASAPKD